jgi:hypothetical protein
MGLYPYAERFPVTRAFPQQGRPRAEVLAEIVAMAEIEDSPYHEGKISGSIYSGDVEHYEFLNEVFGHYSHANVLQRDVYPSATRFEGEIIAMAAELLHARAPAVRCAHQRGHREPDEPDARVPRVGSRARASRTPTWCMPETAHPALHKGGHYFGIEMRKRRGHRHVRGRHGLDAVAGRREHRRARRFGRHLPARPDRPDRRDERPRARARHQPARRRLPRWLHPLLGPRTSASACRCSTSGTPVSPRSAPTPTSTASG